MLGGDARISDAVFLVRAICGTRVRKHVRPWQRKEDPICRVFGLTIVPVQRVIIFCLFDLGFFRLQRRIWHRAFCVREGFHSCVAWLFRELAWTN